MQEKMIDMHRQGYANFSHFGPEANLFEELEALFREYGERGTGKVRRYLHNEEDARPHGLKAGMFTPWEDLPAGSDVLFYEGLHGAVKTAKVNIARHADLLIGIVRRSISSGYRKCIATRARAVKRKKRLSRPFCAACQTT
jgi:phosphoribulokinase